MKQTLCLIIFTIANIQLQSQVENPQKIMDKCIEVHGGDRYQDAHFSFVFRERLYEFLYKNGQYQYIRFSKDGTIKDVLNNSGFKRFITEKEVQLSEKDIRRYSNSVNSVHYFAFLPFFLNDQAVNKSLLGRTTINGKPYYEIEVTFSQEGGGDDFEDRYVYWIHQDNYTLDFLAYSFHVNGGGVRFREAYNQRSIGNIRFQDYINYKHDKNTAVDQLDELFQEGKLIELSKIELENIKRL